MTARSTEQIRGSAHFLIDTLSIDSQQVPILKIIETVLPHIDEEFTFQVMSAAELERRYGTGVEGITDHQKNTIILRSDVYEGAHRGNGRDRFTAAHELGHYFLHRNEGLAFMRAAPPETKAYQSSEWQANTYAGELLVDVRKININDSPTHIATTFGVSYSVAEIQINKAKKIALGKGLF
ncbi:MAG: ImmA/IrrE family metallo-endopeptidase [Burkholderiaceae bacterium]|nr:ImmA/IrrE family metallo-endopeptidase [Burkholderiaceae bacterium]